MSYKIVFENSFYDIKNTILVFSRNCSYYLNLVVFFFVPCFFMKKKTLGIKCVFLIFIVLFVFET